MGWLSVMDNPNHKDGWHPVIQAGYKAWIKDWIQLEHGNRELGLERARTHYDNLFDNNGEEYGRTPIFCYSCRDKLKEYSERTIIEEALF
jgi:hypothetical protein